MKFKISPGIFQKFSGVRIGVLILLGIDNTGGGEEIGELLVGEQEKGQKESVGVDLKEHPQVAPWREIYRQFGSKPRKYRSSVEALLRRVQSGSRLPSINPLVDLYNYLSVKHILPAGAEDLDKVKGDIQLTFAEGDETGSYIGASEAETCYQGEVVYKDDLGFICRRWNWREAERTKIDRETKNAALVLEAVPAVSGQEFQEALNDAENLIKKFFGGKVIVKVLTQEDPVLEVDFEGGQKAREEKVVAEKKVRPEVKKEKETKPFKKVTDDLIDKSGVAYKLQEAVWRAAREFDKGLKIEDVYVEHPAVVEHGDYATNIALQLAKVKKGGGWHSPLEFAEEIADRVQRDVQEYAKVTVAEPGFINFTLTSEALIRELERVLQEKDNFGKGDVLKGKKILLEHTSPDPIKTLHIGQLRNNFLGMAMSRILESLGAKVTKDCINNDRGVHVARAMFGFLVFAKKGIGLDKKELASFKVSDEKIRKIAARVRWGQLLDEWFKNKDQWLSPHDLGLKSDHFDLVVYATGARAEDRVERVKEQVREILRAWEKEEKKVWALWRMIIDWSLKGYEETYKRIGSIHDYFWHESDLYQGGKKLVSEGLKRGVFKKSEGAIVSNLAKYGLPDTVVIKSDGTALYHTFDLYFTQRKREKFPSDLYIWDIGNDQILYLKQLFAMDEQLGIGKRGDYFHLNYGYVYLKSGEKMASRKGMVVKADDLLDFVYQRAREIMEKSELDSGFSEKEKEEVAEAVGVGALKYGLLKFSREKDVHFDPEESVSLEGDSGPYLQYTHARCCSVLVKARQPLTAVDQSFAVNAEELALLRAFYKFPEIVVEAGKNFAPNLICNFLFDLAQKFNLFYNRWPILEPKVKSKKSEVKSFRLALTSATAQILKKGLLLLGIEPLERM